MAQIWKDISLVNFFRRWKKFRVVEKLEEAKNKNLQEIRLSPEEYHLIEGFLLPGCVGTKDGSYEYKHYNSMRVLTTDSEPFPEPEEVELTFECISG